MTFKFRVVAAYASVLGVLLCGFQISMADPCDGSRLAGDTEKCSKDYAASVFCENKDPCSGAGAKAHGPNVEPGCSEPDPNDPNTLCEVKDRDCVPQWGCTEAAGGGCEASVELSTQYLSSYAALESCTPSS